ncbi:MAG TPA: 2-dehydropantoate 2-reductase [Candidatus Dormibacteraeota bacterium]|nr:2-dehydropantoate 2-reductase [Candidatus Dormibacteraeota bacterium]
MIAGNVTVVGAGAIGGFVAARLASAGIEVTVCDRNREHVEAIRRSGLAITGAVRMHQPLDAVLPEELEADLGTVLLAVKTVATAPALATIGPRLRPDGCVVSLQNGLQVYEIARALGAGRTVGGFLTFGGHYVRPGEVAYGGSGSFRIGELDGRLTSRVQDLVALLSTAHPAEQTANLLGFLWAKTAILAFYFASALADLEVQDLIGSRRHRRALAGVVGEVAQVARAEGIQLEVVDGFDPEAFAAGDEARIEASWEAQLRYWDGHTSRRTGIWRDLALHHRETEVGGILVPVVERARERGVAVPLLQRTVEMVRAAERGERGLGPANLEELAAATR